MKSIYYLLLWLFFSGLMFVFFWFNMSNDVNIEDLILASLFIGLILIFISIPLFSGILRKKTVAPFLCLLAFNTALFFIIMLAYGVNEGLWSSFFWCVLMGYIFSIFANMITRIFLGKNHVEEQEKLIGHCFSYSRDIYKRKVNFLKGMDRVILYRNLVFGVIILSICFSFSSYYYFGSYKPKKIADEATKEEQEMGNYLLENDPAELQPSFSDDDYEDQMDKNEWIKQEIEDRMAYHEGYESAKNQSWRAGEPINFFPQDGEGEAISYLGSYFDGYYQYCQDYEIDCSLEVDLFRRVWARLIAFEKFKDKRKNEDDRVERYGLVIQVSGSNSMKFYYYDIEENKIYETWNGYPWFWAGKYEPEEEAEEFIKFMGTHEHYVFKISGYKAEDDCYYLPDGDCVEDIEIENIEAIKKINFPVDEKKQPFFYGDENGLKV